MAKKEKIKEKNKKHFLKDYKAELKKVIWPTPKQLLNNTIAVLTIVLITAVIVFVLDVVFDMFNKYVITELQSKVETTYSENSTTDSNVTSTNETNTVEDTNEVDANTTNETENNVQ